MEEVGRRIIVKFLSLVIAPLDNSKLRLIAYIGIIIFFSGCGQRNNNDSKKLTIYLAKDTLESDNYLLFIENADSFSTNDIYGDIDYRSKLTDTIGNWHERAIKIQYYLSSKFGNYFYTTDTTLVLLLEDGKKETFALWDEQKDEGYNFEHYFDNINYYLLRVQFGEGNCWMLVNRKNGFKKYISGLPYISNDLKKIICINSDLEAGYSFNGLELYTIQADSLQTLFSKETEWGPIDLKWVNGNQFFIKREHFHVDSLTSVQDNKIDFKLVTFEKKRGQ
jgi:hypothetical protein